MAHDDNALSSALFQIFETCLDLLSAPAIAVDGDLKATPLNRLARELLAGDSGLSLRNGELQPERTADRRPLVRALGNAVRDPASPPTAVAIQRGRRAGQLCLLVSPAGSAAGRWATVLAMDTSWVTIPEPQFLVTWFDLTCKEAQLTAQIARGRPVEEAATDLGMALGTARTHMKHIFMKTGVSSQAQLVTLTRAVAFGQRREALDDDGDD